MPAPVRDYMNHEHEMNDHWNNDRKVKEALLMAVVKSSHEWCFMCKLLLGCVSNESPDAADSPFSS